MYTTMFLVQQPNGYSYFLICTVSDRSTCILAPVKVHYGICAKGVVGSSFPVSLPLLLLAEKGTFQRAGIKMLFGYETHFEQNFSKVALVVHFTIDQYLLTRVIL